MTDETPPEGPESIHELIESWARRRPTSHLGRDRCALGELAFGFTARRLVEGDGLLAGGAPGGRSVWRGVPPTLVATRCRLWLLPASSGPLGPLFAEFLVLCCEPPRLPTMPLRRGCSLGQATAARSGSPFASPLSRSR